MVELKSFQMFLILMIPFTAAVTQHLITVRVGEEATLPCKGVKDYEDECLSTTWLFNYLTNGPTSTLTLFENGTVHSKAASKSDRLSVTEKCSLVIKKVTDEDVGLYTCRQFDEGQIVAESSVVLSLDNTTLTQHCSNITVRVGEEATLPCKDVKDYQDECLSTTWIFNYLTSGPTVPLFEYGKIPRDAASNSDRLSVTEKCSLVIKKVTDEDVGRYICRQFISEQTVTDSWVYLSVVHRDNIATPTTTTKLPTTTKRTTQATKATSRPTITDPAAPKTSLNSGLKAVLITVAVLAAFLIIFVAVIRWKKAKGYNTQLEDNTDDPPDGVSYASIRYKKTKNKTRVQGEDDTVTYSTINTSSTSAGASTDPRNLYASINKTNR